MKIKNNNKSKSFKCSNISLENDNLLKIIDQKRSAKKESAKIPLYCLINNIIEQAQKEDTVDIWIERRSSHSVIRFFTVNNKIKDFLKLEEQLTEQLINYIKMLAEMDLAIKSIPQDNILRIKPGQGEQEQVLRAVTIPTVNNGEQIVIRLKDVNNI
jgi:type II secretory ATPase GspE/PulE/Tfp pilus assembly ATPase PilB-like protein